MELGEFNKKILRDKHLFNPDGYGKIYTFVDFANVRQWAKGFWPTDNKERFRREVDIKKIGKIIEWVSADKKFFYYGHYKSNPKLPDDHNLNFRYRQSIFRIDKARKNRFTIRTKYVKEIKIFDEDGKFSGKIHKCNFDIEIALDMLTKINKYDTIFLWSGDSDFDLLLKYLKNKGKKIVIICARNYLSKELHRIADKFIPAERLKEELEYKKNDS